MGGCASLRLSGLSCGTWRLVAANTLYTRICSIVNVGSVYLLHAVCSCGSHPSHGFHHVTRRWQPKCASLCSLFLQAKIGSVGWFNSHVSPTGSQALHPLLNVRLASQHIHNCAHIHITHSLSLPLSYARTHAGRRTHTRTHTHTHTHTHALSHCNTHRRTLSLTQTHTLTLTETWREALRYSPPGFHQSCSSVGPRDTCLHRPMSRHCFK